MGTFEKEEFESISSAGHGMKSKPFFSTTFISHPYLMYVNKCGKSGMEISFYK